MKNKDLKLSIISASLIVGAFVLLALTLATPLIVGTKGFVLTGPAVLYAVSIWFGGKEKYEEQAESGLLALTLHAILIYVVVALL